MQGKTHTLEGWSVLDAAGRVNVDKTALSTTYTHLIQLEASHHLTIIWAKEEQVFLAARPVVLLRSLMLRFHFICTDSMDFLGIKKAMKFSGLK